MAAPTWILDIADIPRIGGAYVLFCELLRPLTVPMAGCGAGVALPLGLYAYAGSANGPGGLGARIARHCRPAKSVRWHIDRLTNTAGVGAVLALADGKECALRAGLQAWPGTTIPAPRFGASDCKTCPAHLVLLAEGETLNDALSPARLEGLFQDIDPTQAWVWRAAPAACMWRPQGKKS